MQTATKPSVSKKLKAEVAEPVADLSRRWEKANGVSSATISRQSGTFLTGASDENPCIDSQRLPEAARYKAKTYLNPPFNVLHELKRKTSSNISGTYT